MTILYDRLQEEDVINLNDWQAAEVLNSVSENITAIGEINIKDVLNRLQKWGIYGEIQWQAARGDNPPSKLCHQVLAVLEPSKTNFTGLDITDPYISQSFELMGQGLIAVGLLTQEQFDELWDLRIKNISWSEKYLGYSVTSREVGLERGGK